MRQLVRLRVHLPIRYSRRLEYDRRCIRRPLRLFLEQRVDRLVLRILGLRLLKSINNLYNTFTYSTV